MIEESPCPILTPFLRMKMGAAAMDVAMTLNYVGALTVEFFYFPDNGREFYFNEINSRLQVEHCITELATGIDLVAEQIKIATGEPLSIDQDDVRLQQHAIDCRINAEDPLTFSPRLAPFGGFVFPWDQESALMRGSTKGTRFPTIMTPS